MWKQILTPTSLTNILEYYAQIIEEKNLKTGKKTLKQVFPRHHQLDLVRTVLSDAASRGVGKRYLIQHSAGSGKSNSIAWLAHQLIGLRNPKRERGTGAALPEQSLANASGCDGDQTFDSIIVITDRRILDQQIDATIRQFMQVGSTVGHARHSGDLRKFIEAGKKIIISTVQKFPFVLEEIGDQHRGRNFGIIIDEAHSSQSGKAAAAVSEALSDPEDTINDALEKRMAARKMLTFPTVGGNYVPKYSAISVQP